MSTIASTAPALPAASATNRAEPAKSQAQLKAQEFEAIFLGQMAKLMFETVDMGDQFTGGHGEEMFRGILAERLGEEMARRGGVGLSPAVLDQIIRMQGGTANGQ